MNYLWQKFLVELNNHNQSALDEFSIIYCDSASSTFLHGLSGRNMLNLVRHTNLCIHNSENYMFLWVVLHSCILTLVYQLIVKSMRAFVYRCLLILWSVKPFYRRMIGETNSSSSSISRIGSKQLCSADQNASPPFDSVLPWSITVFMSGFSWGLHRLLWILDVVILLAIINHSSVPCCRNRNADKWIVMCEFNTPSNLVAW